MFTLMVIFAAVFSALWGFYKGLFRLLLRVAVLLLAYAMTWQETPSLATWLASQQLVPGMLAWPVAGLVLFLGGSIIFSLIARWLLHISPETWQQGGRISGALAGAALGGIAGLLLVWAAGVLLDSRQLQMAGSAGTSGPANNGTVTIESVVRNTSGEAMATLVHGVLGDTPAATAAAQWVREPLSVGNGLKRLAEKPELRALFENPVSYAVLVGAEPGEIQQLPAFQAITADPEIMPFLSAIGLPGESLPEQSAELARLLSRYARNFEHLRTTPEFQSLAQDAGLQEKLKQGNLMVLLTDEKMRRLAEMLANGSQLDKLPPAPAPAVTASAPTEKLPPKPLYKWTDSSGHLHITEQRPPEGVKAELIEH